MLVSLKFLTGGAPRLGCPLCLSRRQRAKVTVPRPALGTRGVRAFPMILHTRLLITTVLLCHLLFAPTLVTSQLLSSPAPSETVQGPPHLPAALHYEDVEMTAIQQERDGPVFKLHGKAVIHFETYVLHGDEVTYNSDTGDSTAEGHVLLEGGPYDEHIEAQHATYNLRTQAGHFIQVNGTIGMKKKGVRMMLTSASPFALAGKTADKTGPGHYIVYDGTITTCRLARPKWAFDARKAVVDAGANAQIYFSSFRIMGIPIFYFPYATHPVEKERQSGFSIPDFATSSIKGEIFGESAYWAINRSMDLSVTPQYYTKRGWAPRGEFRARPTESSFVDLSYDAVFDHGYCPTATPCAPDAIVKQGGQDVKLDAGSLFPGDFRGVASIDYLTSYVYRLAFNDVFTEAVNSEVKSQAFLSRMTSGFSYDLMTERYQDYESTDAGDVVTVNHAPSVESASVDQQLGRSPFYWSYDAALDGLSRSEPPCSPLSASSLTCTFEPKVRTGDTARIDVTPELSLPVLFGGWSLRPALDLHETFYSRQTIATNATGAAVDNAINRKAIEGSVELRPPPLERIFGHTLLGRKWKHVIEPNAIYRYVTGVDNFGQILRFDERDILSDTNEVEYGVVNRLYAKRVSGNNKVDCGTPGMPALMVGAASAPVSMIPWERWNPVPTDSPCKGPQIREVVRWELMQKYYIDPTFGGALIPGTRNVLDATADLTGIAFLTDARRFSPLVSRLHVETNSHTDAEWDLDYDIKKGRVNASTALFNYYLGNFTIGAGDAFLQTAGENQPNTTVPQRFDQWRLLAGYGRTNKQGFSTAANLGFDAHLNYLQYASVQTTYNWDCCGVSIEWRRFALGQVRNENQYRFTFALANIGAIGNLRRQERLF